MGENDSLAPKLTGSVDTHARRWGRRGRPTLIHDSYRKGTFRGNLKKVYKFGPAFMNLDRKDMKVKVAPREDAVERVENDPESPNQYTIGFWGRIWKWVVSLFKTNNHAG